MYIPKVILVKDVLMLGTNTVGFFTIKTSFYTPTLVCVVHLGTVPPLNKLDRNKGKRAITNINNTARLLVKIDGQ